MSSRSFLPGAGLALTSFAALAALATARPAAPQGYGVPSLHGRPASRSSAQAGPQGGPRAAHPRYGVTEIPSLPGQADSFVASTGTLNNRGQVASVSDINLALYDDHAQLWDKGQLQELPRLPDANNSAALALNDAGQVFGASGPTDGTSLTQQHPVRWDQKGVTDLGLFPGDTFGIPLGANDRGQAVGWGGDLSLTYTHALVWDQGKVTLLAELPGFPDSLAQATNDRGQTVGVAFSGPFAAPFRAVLWDRGGVTDLGTFGGTSAEALGINNHGAMVGGAETESGEPHAFLWQKGVMTDLGTLGGTYSEGFHINDYGQVVGVAATPSGDNHAFLWQHGVMNDLNDLIPDDSGWVLINGEAINASGEIAGNGLHNGQVRGYVLTPLTKNG